MPRGGAKPGERRGGRRKGTPNKVTSELKAALGQGGADLRASILAAYESVGGTKYLEGVARKDHKTFCSLLGRALPHDLNHSGAVGTYVAQPIPTEQRDSDALEGAARPPAEGGAG